MKNHYSTLIAIGVVALVGYFTAGRVEAQTITHDDLQHHWNRALPAADRFVSVLSGAAVVDRETGLAWEMAPGTSTFDWFGAHGHCNTKVVGNRRGWRLPTVQELASLIDPTQANPALPAGHPFDNVQLQSSFYWSATTFADDPTNAWLVFLGSGDVFIDAKPLSRFVWCVRRP